MKNGMGGHQGATMKKDEWLTPPEIIEALGEFDLDPCAPVARPWSTAAKHYTLEDNGLLMSWEGRVWLNPPYGKETGQWLGKLADHGNGVALIFARTETKTWFDCVWYKADAVLFIKGRLFFYHVDGTQSTNSSGAPSALIAYGQNNVEALAASKIKGSLILLPPIDVGKEPENQLNLFDQQKDF